MNYKKLEQEPVFYKLIWNTNVFDVPFNDLTSSINPDISFEIKSKGQYQIKSDISENVLKNFVQYLTELEIPDFGVDNILEYERLSNEFDIMKNLVNLYKNHMNYKFFPLQAENEELKKMIYAKSDILQQKTQNNQKIIYFLFFNKGIASYVKLKNKLLIRNACEEENVSLIDIYTRLKVEIDGITYILDEEQKTASVYGINFCDDSLILPPKINYNSEDYVITNIVDLPEQREEEEDPTVDETANDLNNKEEMKKDSTINETVSDANEEEEEEEEEAEEDLAASETANDLNNKEEMKKDSTINEAVSDVNEEEEEEEGEEGEEEEEEEYLPIEIPENYEGNLNIHSIEPNVLINSNDSTGLFIVPPNLSEFKEDWCAGDTEIIRVLVMPSNKHFINYDKYFVLGKSDQKSDIFDVLFFCNRDARIVIVPPFIKRIAPYAFYYCQRLRTVNFTEDSQLEIIDKCAFQDSGIRKISIPIHVKHIAEYAFSECSNLSKVDIDKNSELQSIGKEAFAHTILKSFLIPPSVTYFSSDCFYNGESIIVELMPNNQNYTYYENMFILKKSHPKSDIFDVLVFTNRFVTSAIIPSFVRIIESYAFNECRNIRTIRFADKTKLRKINDFAFINCSIPSITIPSTVTFIGEKAFSFCEQLEKFDFEPNSKLKSIMPNMFNFSSIETLVIPPTVDRLYEGWCYEAKKLKEIILMPNNPRFSMYNGTFLLGKSDLKNFDVLLFANRNIEKAEIPSFIKIIDSYSFANCLNLKNVFFSQDSELRIIKKYAFTETAIESIRIPPRVSQIDKYAFSIYAQNVEFTNNPNAIRIHHYAFNFERVHFYRKLYFQALPKRYEAMRKRIENDNLKQIYSQFIFLYFSYQFFHKENSVINQLMIIDFLFESLKIHKFIVFNLYNRYLCKDYDGGDFVVDAIFCFESSFLIIEKIKVNLINEVINRLKKEKISLLNISKENNKKETIDEKNISEEIQSFQRHFRFEIHKNQFLELTMSSIACYLIRRYYYPSSYFKDDSFFHFVDDLAIERTVKNSFLKISKESYLRSISFYDLIESVSNYISKTNKIYSNANKKAKNNHFKKNDFIILRTIHPGYESAIYLVIHIKSLHVFTMKCVADYSSKEFQHEIDFCINYSHRCLNTFCGFLYEEETIIGFIYDFMCNGSLESYLSSNKNEIDDLFILTTINRILQSLIYLKSNYLVHRDLKPSNILLNHDFQPFLSDFETIRSIKEVQDSSSEIEFTSKFGSILYMSPEQYNDEPVSYSSDVFTFGLIIYFLYEKKKMRTCENEVKNNEVKQMTRAPKYIQDIYELCLKKSPEERPTHEKILSLLINEINSIDDMIQYLLNSNIEQELEFIIQYFIESMIALLNRHSSFHYYLQNLTLFLDVKRFQDSINRKYFRYILHSDEVCELGNDFYYGINVKRDYIIARKIYEKLAKKNNILALNQLGLIYTFGLSIQNDYEKSLKIFEFTASRKDPFGLLYVGLFHLFGLSVQQDFIKAKNYFELSVAGKNLDALYYLGLMHIHGLGVDKDYEKALRYFESAAKQDHSKTLCYLGNLYQDGIYIQKDIWKSKYYYKLAAQFDNSDALYGLGTLYEKGDVIEKDYQIAMYYFEMAAKLGNCKALNILGNYYLNGILVMKDYLSAIKYFFKSADLNNKEAIFNLGNIFFNGYGTKKNPAKAIKYFEMSANLNFSDALLKLSRIHSNGEFKNIDISKAIFYLEKCINIQNELSFDTLFNIEYVSNKNLYLACNDLGLIYVTFYNDINKGIEFIKEAAFAEFPFAQSNFGLLNQFFLNDIKKAEYMYQRSSEHQFAIAEYNLGYLKEKEGQIDQSINYYKNVSEHEDVPLVFHGNVFYDKRLFISTQFIICLADFKLTSHFLSQSNFEEAKKYFIKSFPEKEEDNEEEEEEYDENDVFIHNYPFYFKLHYEMNRSEENHTEAFKPMKTNKSDSDSDEDNVKENSNKKLYKQKLNEAEKHKFDKEKEKLNDEKTDSYSDSDEDDQKVNSYRHSFRQKLDEIEKSLNEKFYSKEEKNNNDSGEEEFNGNDDPNSDVNLIQENLLNFYSRERQRNNFSKEEFRFVEENIRCDFEYMKSFILNIPILNFKNQPDLDLNKFMNINHKEPINSPFIVFDYAGDLFDFVIQNENLLKCFICAINDLIHTFEEILYKPPYTILFGRINIAKKNFMNQIINEALPLREEVNEKFYEGFQIDI